MQLQACDLFCGAGGASAGLDRAGFEVSGVDHVDQPEYPYMLYARNVFDLPIWVYRTFDFLWASPPCQRYSQQSAAYIQKGIIYPDLIEKTRKLLDKVGKPYVIENVRGAPIRKDLMLCGEMFGLKVIRHRYFEIKGFKPIQPWHEKHKGLVINPKTKGRPYRKNGYYYTVVGKCFGAKVYGKAMGIDWMKKIRSITEAVPPAYSKYIGEQFIQYKKANKQ